MDNDNCNIMSENNGQISNLQPHEIDDSHSTSLVHDTHEADTEIRDIGTPLDDEPEISDSLEQASDNAGMSKYTEIDGIKNNDIIEATDSTSQEQLAVNDISYEEPSWIEQTSRPHSSSAATPTQDDNISAEDISGIPVPTTGPQFLNFSQPASTQNNSISENSEFIGSIPLPQVTDDGSDADIAIVDAISNVNVISGSIKPYSDKKADTRNESDEATEKDEFGRDMPRRKKVKEIEQKIVTVEEVSDDDLPEVIEERRFGNREEIASDADSNYSMVSNNSLSAENCHTSDKDKKSKRDEVTKAAQDAAERDEISSLSGLSSEDEMKENDRLQVLIFHTYRSSVK